MNHDKKIKKMNQYKYILALMILFFLSISAYSQKKSKEITIRYFSELTGDDIATLEKINNEFFRKKNDKNKAIKLINLYTNKTMLLNKQSDFKDKIKSYNTPINNVSYANDDILIKKINDFNLTHLISYKTDLNTQGDFGHLYSNLNDLLQVIKKDKESSINLVYANGFVLYQYGLENFKLVYQEYKANNELSELIPNIVHPYLTEQLHPVGDGYLIEFDSVGWFSEYEIEINSTSEKNKGTFVKKRLKFSQNYEEIAVSSADPNMYYSGDNRRCYIYIPAKLLDSLCIKLNNSAVLNPNQVPSKDSCKECRNPDLYSTRFEMRLRGYGNGYNKSDLWSDYISRFSFQCTRDH
jgi:hypothetical protein